MTQQPSKKEEDQKDPVIVDLEKQKQIQQLKMEIEELKKESAEAKRDALLAGLPSSETKGLSGEVTFSDKAGYFADLLAYETLSAVAKKIAEALGEASSNGNGASAKDPPQGPGNHSSAPTGGDHKNTDQQGEDKKSKVSKSSVVIADDFQIPQKMQLWELVEQKLEGFEKRFDDLLEWIPEVKKGEDIVRKKSLAPILAALPGLLGGIADIAAFFKIDQEFIGRSITLAKAALIAEVAAALKEKQWNVFLPALSTSVEGSLLEYLDKLSSKRAEVEERRGELAATIQPELEELAELRNDLIGAEAELERLKKADPPEAQEIEKVEEKIEELKADIDDLAKLEIRWTEFSEGFAAVLSAYEEYEGTLTEGIGEKPSPIEALAVIDSIQANPEADRLFLGIVSQGSEVHVKKSVWPFWSGISYIGGSVCLYFWFDKDGKYKGSDSIPFGLGQSMKIKVSTGELIIGGPRETIWAKIKTILAKFGSWVGNFWSWIKERWPWGKSNPQ